MLTKPPGESFRGPLPPLTEAQKRLATALREQVKLIATDIGPRNMQQIDALNRTAEHIAGQLRHAGYQPQFQEYRVRGQIARNIIAEIPGHAQRDEIIVVGAHYDTVEDCPGANDNTSGVAAVLELARSLARTKPARTIRLVFFVNEEPPYFQTESMGSMVYAKSCRERRDQIVAMLAIETIGWYLDDPGSQHYPEPIEREYPDTGNFIAFVSNPESKQLMFDAIGSFRTHAKFPSEGGAAPAFIVGVGWSDHWSFWQYDYPAIMVTDTAPFRYPQYHRPTDTAEKLDYERMARVVEGLNRVVAELANPRPASR